jgi:branched-subunit amino acid transport protein
MNETGWLASAWAFIAVAALATYVWRGAGVALSGRIDPNSRTMRWVTNVAYAMLAGLIARLIVIPQGGSLADTALWMRLVAAALAIAVYFLCRRSIALGVAAGAGLMIALTAAGF